MKYFYSTSNQCNTQCTNTQKFWSDQKSRLTDILDPKKRYNKTRLFLTKKKIQQNIWEKSIEYWLLGQREDRGWKLRPRGSARIRADARTADSARTTKFRAADADLARTWIIENPQT